MKITDTTCDFHLKSTVTAYFNILDDTLIEYDHESIPTFAAASQKQTKMSNTDTRRQKLKASRTYSVLGRIAEVMDRYYLDPLLGLIPGGWGDLASMVLVAPFLYVAAVRLKSFRLTLAIVYNLTKDCLLGLLPFFIGDVVDFFSKSYRENYRLVTGFINNDRAVVHEVNSGATKFGVLIVVFCALIVLLLWLLVWLGQWVISLLGGS